MRTRPREVPGCSPYCDPNRTLSVIAIFTHARFTIVPVRVQSHRGKEKGSYIGPTTPQSQEVRGYTGSKSKEPNGTDQTMGHVRWMIEEAERACELSNVPFDSLPSV